jgi:hypothetical protein
MNIKLTRYGDFRLTSKDGNQCASIHHQLFRYEAFIEASPQALDDRGFLVDHMELDSIVKEAVRTQGGSCEQIAMRMCEAIVQHLVSKRVVAWHSVGILITTDGRLSKLECRFENEPRPKPDLGAR